ncbi:ATP-binding protein [Pseudomonas protegens]|uniref:ATP-binding protein n=1 Tax=Pseudomonas protegens TaxID=380021 RepID=UPI0022649235|nr:ATP-binding protein [Pseudomonas protegens]
MDDSMLDQLETALRASPGNQALLTLLLKACLERSDYERGLRLLPEDLQQWAEADELKALAAQLYLAAGDPEKVLSMATGSSPAQGLLRAHALAELQRLKEAQAEYRAAIEQNPALEDMVLWRRLNVSVVDFPGAEGRPRLRVISNDDTDRSEAHRLLVPEPDTVTFADIGGLDELKKTIHKKIILPYQKPGLFQRFRKRVGGGVLLYGPPGCGKTLLARATAGECKAKFFNVAISDVLDMYIGESERKLHALFAKARAEAPAVMFFDEVEALGGKRSNTRESTSSKLVSQFLSEMDGFSNDNHGVLILAATNVPWSVDSAFRRPGRFDRVLFVPPPDRPARENMLRMMMSGRPMAQDIDFAFLAKSTSGFSGADLGELVETAADEAIEESINEGAEQAICDRHFKHALKDVRATTLEWLTTARNYARYANEGNQYDEVLSFLEKNGKGR